MKNKDNLEELTSEQRKYIKEGLKAIFGAALIAAPFFFFAAKLWIDEVEQTKGYYQAKDLIYEGYKRKDVEDIVINGPRIYIDFKDDHGYNLMAQNSLKKKLGREPNASELSHYLQLDFLRNPGQKLHTDTKGRYFNYSTWNLYPEPKARKEGREEALKEKGL